MILAKVREGIDLIDEGKRIPLALSEAIVESWFQVQKFISPILKFSSSHEEYLAPFPYFKLVNATERNPDSLRSLVGENEDLIFAINDTFTDIEKLKQIERNTKLIESNFKLNSEFHKLIENRKTDWKEFLDIFESELHTLGAKVAFNNKTEANHSSILIPESYARKLILDEIINNLRNHCKKGDSSEIQVLIKDINSNNFQIEILNPIALMSQSNSNGEGTKCLNLLSASEYFGFNYDAKPRGEQYHQILKFTTL